jgi:hypothetical protein
MPISGMTVTHVPPMDYEHYYTVGPPARDGETPTLVRMGRIPRHLQRKPMTAEPRIYVSGPRLFIVVLGLVSLAFVIFVIGPVGRQNAKAAAACEARDGVAVRGRDGEPLCIARDALLPPRP